MRCISCEKLSFLILCKSCQKNYLKPTFQKRELLKDFYVYSFYSYDDMKTFLNSKYQFYGDRIFNILGELAFQKFSQNFELKDRVIAIPIDDHTRHEFSQTAILTKHLKSPIITPKYNTLKATNIVKYAGKNLEFRQKNKRKFHYKGAENQKVILVDDIITTGTTILEAKECVEKSGCEVLFALTLSDAKF